MVGIWFQKMEVGLVPLLRAAWIAGTFPILIASLPLSKLRSFRGLVMGFAKRGKIMKSSSSKFTVPQRFFLHFYLWAVVWTTFLLVTTWTYAYKMAPLVTEPFVYPTITTYLTGGSVTLPWRKSSLTPIRPTYLVWRAVFMLVLMDVQVLRRLYETIYVFDYSPSARMHILGYLTGLYFYTAAPLSLCCDYAPDVYNLIKDLVAEFIVRGKSQMPDVELNLWQLVNPLFKLGWREVFGAAVFFWGWNHQRLCHAILGSLRGQSEQSEEYVIPRGDWFEYVSSPHYLSEISSNTLSSGSDYFGENRLKLQLTTFDDSKVIYAGLVVASGGADLTICLLFTFVVANLVFAAAETHRWYLQKFEDYPRNRAAIVPFVF